MSETATDYDEYEYDDRATIDKLKELLAKATAGKWTYSTLVATDEAATLYSVDDHECENDIAVFEKWDNEYREVMLANAELIALLHNNAANLIAAGEENVKLKAQVDAMGFRLAKMSELLQRENKP